MKILNILFLSAIVGLASCSKETTTTTDPTGDPSPSTEYFFHADINGTYNLLEDTKNNYVSKQGSQDEGSVKRTFSTLANASDQNSFELMVIGDLATTNPNAADVYDMFKVGSYAFSNKTKDGIIVNWKDEAGNTWTSNTQFGGQSSSSFIIESVGSFIGSKKTFKVTGIFNCRVYDIASNFKTLENAKFSVIFDAAK